MYEFYFVLIQKRICRLIDACVMECYFREHMAERNLLFHDTFAPHRAAYAPWTCPSVCSSTLVPPLSKKVFTESSTTSNPPRLRVSASPREPITLNDSIIEAAAPILRLDEFFQHIASI